MTEDDNEILDQCREDPTTFPSVRKESEEYQDTLHGTSQYTNKKESEYQDTLQLTNKKEREYQDTLQYTNKKEREYQDTLQITNKKERGEYQDTLQYTNKNALPFCPKIIVSPNVIPTNIENHSRGVIGDTLNGTPWKSRLSQRKEESGDDHMRSMLSEDSVYEGIQCKHDPVKGLHKNIPVSNLSPRPWPSPLPGDRPMQCFLHQQETKFIYPLPDHLSSTDCRNHRSELTNYNSMMLGSGGIQNQLNWPFAWRVRPSKSCPSMAASMECASEEPRSPAHGASVFSKDAVSTA